MIKNIIDLLNQDNYYRVSNRVDRAKGLYGRPRTLKSAWQQLKRVVYGSR